MNDFFKPCFVPCSGTSGITPNLRKNNTEEYKEQQFVLSMLIRGSIRVTIVQPNCKCNPCIEKRQKECMIKKQQYCNDCEDDSSDCDSDCADVDTDSDMDAITERIDKMPPPSKPSQRQYNYYENSSDDDDYDH